MDLRECCSLFAYSIKSTLIFFLLAVVGLMGLAIANLYISNGIAIVLLWVFRGKLEWSEKKLSELPDENVPQGDVVEEKETKNYPEID